MSCGKVGVLSPTYIPFKGLMSCGRIGHVFPLRVLCP